MKGILETRNLFNTDKGFFGVVVTIVLLPIILLILLKVTKARLTLLVMKLTLL